MRYCRAVRVSLPSGWRGSAYCGPVGGCSYGAMIRIGPTPPIPLGRARAACVRWRVSPRHVLGVVKSDAERGVRLRVGSTGGSRSGDEGLRAGG